MSSSGLVLPFAASAREGHDTSYVPMPLDSSDTWPAPSMSEPSQWAEAVRVVAISCSPRVGGCGASLPPTLVAPGDRDNPVSVVETGCRVFTTGPRPAPGRRLGTV